MGGVRLDNIAIANAAYKTPKQGLNLSGSIDKQSLTLTVARNVHIFNFERVIGDNETHSGLDTREGKLLRLELQFKDEPLLELKRKNNSVVSTLRRGYSYNEVKVYAFLRFTRMVNISSAGIGISE